ncbi:MAG: aryl-sulfate sulfotransferase [Myxococcota bacterium]
MSRTSLLALAGLAVACTDGDGEPTSSTTHATSPARDVTATVAPDMPTVVTVTWRTDGDQPGHVAFGVDGAFDRDTPEDAGGTEHSAVLVGLPPEATVSFRVVSGDVDNEPQDVVTGALDPDLPELTVEGTHDRWTAVPLLRDGEARIVLLDPQGRVTWSYRDPGELSVFRALVARDGSGLIYNSVVRGGLPAEDSALIRVSWDGATVERVDVPNLAHDFVELPDGTLVSLAFQDRDGVLGNALLAVDRAGTVTELWNSWDCFDPDADPGDDPAQGWTHANALDYDAERDVFLVGLRNLSTLVAVDRATGTCRWSLGVAGDLAASGGSFLHEHQFHLLSDRVLVFDNDGAAGRESRMLEYALDEGAGTAEVVREIHADPPLFSFILGDVHRLPDGDTLVAWGTGAALDRYAPDDTRTFRAALPNGNVYGFFQILDDPYTVP